MGSGFCTAVLVGINGSPVVRPSLVLRGISVLNGCLFIASYYNKCLNQNNLTKSLSIVLNGADYKSHICLSHCCRKQANSSCKGALGFCFALAHSGLVCLSLLQTVCSQPRARLVVNRRLCDGQKFDLGLDRSATGSFRSGVLPQLEPHLRFHLAEGKAGFHTLITECMFPNYELQKHVEIT
jgi:hypothetical protein